MEGCYTASQLVVVCLFTGRKYLVFLPCHTPYTIPSPVYKLCHKSFISRNFLSLIYVFASLNSGHPTLPRNDFVFTGGVPVLTVVVLPKPNFGFFSAGFSIWKEHIKVSSTLIMAPALSNSPQ